MNAKFTQRLSPATVAALIGMIAALPAAADDTEIYSSSTTTTSTASHPNVLLIMDTSGSMGGIVDPVDPSQPRLSRLANMQLALASILDKLNNVNVGLMDFTDVGGPILWPISDINAPACQILKNCGAAQPNVVNARIFDVNDDATENTAAPTNGTPASAPLDGLWNVRLDDKDLAFGDYILNTGNTCPFATTANPLGTFVGSTGASTNIFVQNAVNAIGAANCTLWQSTATSWHQNAPAPAVAPDCKANRNNCNDSRGEVISTSAMLTSNTLNFDAKQVNGLRFTDLAIPRGARVIDAHITYKASNADAGDDIAHYVGQLVNSGSSAPGNEIPPEFTAGANDVKSRLLTPTLNTVFWDMDDWTTGQINSTPDISQIVQEIVCQGVVAANNSIAGLGSVVNLAGTGGAGGCYQGNPAGAAIGSLPGWTPPTAIIGTTQAVGTLITIKLAATASAATSFYNGMSITPTSGPLNGQTRLIIAYNGGTKTATVSLAWASAPATGTTYTITNLNAAATLDAMVESTKNSMTAANSGSNDIGGDMVFISQHDGPTNRRAYSQQGASSRVANHPVLNVTYEPGPWSVNQQQEVAMRFSFVGIPQGATITNASIRFNPSKQTVAQDTTTEIRFRGELATDSAPISGAPHSASDNIIDPSSTRANTASIVYWNHTSTPPLDAPQPGGWRGWNVNEGQTYTSPDLTAMVQEVVNNPAWCGNNHFTVLARRFAGTDTYFAYSADKDRAKAPLLTVTFDASRLPPGGGCINEVTTSQIVASADDAEENNVTHIVTTNANLLNLRQASTVGMRFEKINLPRNTQILHAYLQYTSNSAQAGALDVNYHGELIGDSPQFSGANSNISSRNLTASSVTHTAVPAWLAGQTGSPPPPSAPLLPNPELSPDLAPIIQEIVNQSSWNTFQNLSIIATATGAGNRQLQSWDLSPGSAPILWIQVKYGGGRLPTIITTVRDVLKQQVADFTAATYTPIVSTLYEASQYFQGKPVVWGKMRSHLDPGVTRVSNPASYTGGTVIRAPGCTDANLGAAACTTERISGNPVYISPITSTLSCATNNIIFLTDGLANHNDTENGVDHGLSLVQSQVGSTCRTSTDAALGDTTTGNPISQGEQCGRDLVSWLHNNDLAPALPGIQKLDNFYSVGFNLCNETPVLASNLVINGQIYNGTICCATGHASSTNGRFNDFCDLLAPDPSSVLFLKDMVRAAGGSVVGTNSGYKDASTASDLIAFFNNTFNSILSQQSSFVAPSIAANAFNRLFSRDVVYFGLFLPSLQVKWKGNVKKYSICINPSAACNLGDVLDLNGNVAVDSAGTFKTTSRNFWTGLNPYVESNGQTTTEGGAGGEINDFTTRVIYTETTASGLPPPSGTLLDTPGFRITSNPTDYNSAAAQQIRNLVCQAPATPALGDPNCNNLLLWMLGQDIQDENGNGLITDTRWSFNDVLHSSPVTVTYGKDGIGNFIDKVVVGTNDGGLRVINAITGLEDWEFMPQAMMGNQQTLFSNPQAGRKYGLDITPTVRIINKRGDGIIDPANGDHVYVYIGMRRGGPAIYALDITPPAVLTSTATKVLPKFLWRIDPNTAGCPGPSSCFPNLQETWSKPQSVKIITTTGGSQLSTPVLIFGGGYDASLESGFGNIPIASSPNNGSSIYIVNADTGTRIMSIGGPTSSADIKVPNMTCAIPSDISTVDTTGSGNVDRLYVGDACGHVWRVDLHPDMGATTPQGSSVVGLLASVSDLTTSAANANQRRFFYPPSVVQVKDSVYSNATNGAYDYVLIASGNRAHPLDTTVADRLYAFRDTTIGPMADNDLDNLADGYPTGGVPINETKMVNVTNRVLSPTDTDLAATQSSLGWFYVFPNSGEKGLSAPAALAKTLFLTTYIPQFGAVSCSANSGTGQAYNFNIITTSANYNWNISNTSGTLGLGDRSQMLGAGIPSDVVPVFTAGGVTLLIGSSGGAKNLGKVLSLPVYRTYWYQGS
jgi:type IV pilus assembly protein PilY1